MNGSTVSIEIANKVNCVCCGKECFSMKSPYVCHDCWKDGAVGRFIAELESFNVAKAEEVDALQDRIAELEAQLNNDYTVNPWGWNDEISLEPELHGFGE